LIRRAATICLEVIQVKESIRVQGFFAFTTVFYIPGSWDFAILILKDQ
jgi:hypothetical protein